MCSIVHLFLIPFILHFVNRLSLVPVQLFFFVQHFRLVVLSPQGVITRLPEHSGVTMTRKRSKANSSAPETRNTSERTVETKVPKSHSHSLMWTVLCLTIIIIGGVAFYLYQSGKSTTSTPFQDEQPLAPADSSKRTDHPAKKGGNAKKPDPFASITNKFDETISKELNKAQKHLDKGQVEDSLKKFEDLIRRHPKSPRARYGQAQSLDKLAEKQQSNQLLQQSIDVYEGVASLPDCPVQLKRLALRRAAERWGFFGRSHQAVRVLQQLSGHIPDDVEILNELGVQYLMGGRNRDAEKVYEKVLRIQPNNGFAKSHLGFILKTDKQSFKEAIPLLQEGVTSGEKGSGDGRFYFHLGDALNRIGKPQEARQVYEAAADKGVFLSAIQRSLYNADTKLRAKPWWTPKETGYLSSMRKLETNWKVIRDEGVAILNRATGGFEVEDENLREKGDWKQFTLYSRGMKHVKSCTKTPKTCAIMDTMSEATGCKRGQVKFSVMHPGTHVWPHTGPTNCRLRAHLGLVIPDKVAIRVADVTKTWEEGKVIIIDDSIEHEVWHNGTSFRLIFIVDFWHPDLTPRQRAVLSPI